MGQVYNYDNKLAYAVRDPDTFEWTYGLGPYQGSRLSLWNSGWTPGACVSGLTTVNADVVNTLAYSDVVIDPDRKTPSYENISYINDAINGTGAASTQRYTVTLSDTNRQAVNAWLKNGNSRFFTCTQVSSILPSDGTNVINMFVFNSGNSETTKICIGLRGFYKNAKYTAQQSYNYCFAYGRMDLPIRYMYVNATFCPYAKPSGHSYLYDYKTTLYPTNSIYTTSYFTDYRSNMHNLCNQNNIPINYDSSNISTSFPYAATVTYRVIQYDAASGSVIVENAVSPFYTAGIRSYSNGLQTPIIICCNETYYNTKVLNLVTDNGQVIKHRYDYTFDPNLIPVVGNSGLANSHNNIYGYGHVFYPVNNPYCIWLSDSNQSQEALFKRKGNQIVVSFGNYETTMSYAPTITLAILSNDPNGICYYTVNQLTEGFDKRVNIYPFTPTQPLINTSAVHQALIDALNKQTDQRWTINTSTATVSGVFHAKRVNDSWNVTLNDISINYMQKTYDSVNITVDMVPLNQSTSQYVIKTGISTSEFVDALSSTISLTWAVNGVNILLPCSARTYSQGTYVGVQALSVNQNTFGLALEYLQQEPNLTPEQNKIFDPFLEHYFGSNDTIIESEEDDVIN